jgi:transposase
MMSGNTSMSEKGRKIMATRRTLSLTEKEREKLIEHRDHDSRPYVRERCAAMLKIAKGKSPHWVSQHGLLKKRDPDTVYNWLDYYEEEGLAGLIAHRHGGNQRGGFDQEKKDALLERLRQGPGEEARQAAGINQDGPTPNCWTLRTIRASVEWLRDYTLSGVWRVLQRLGINLRRGRIQQYSPDPDYEAKVEYIWMCLRHAAQEPEEAVVLFLDEMGYYRWPEVGSDWGKEMPVAERQETKQQKWRLIGAINAVTGEVEHLDGYIVGRAKVIEMYQQIAERYADVSHIYVIQDNWNIHKHEDVMEALEELPRIEPVWLPTYAPWLNPIEKLWKWLRKDVLKLHDKAGAWEELKQLVRDFLDQFAQGSDELLRYVGLLGDGKLAQALGSV